MVWGGVSSRAVDGNSNTIYDAGLTCTHTLDEMNPWWRVDLGRVEPVTEVYLVSRGDCCEHSLSLFEIRVGRLDFISGMHIVYSRMNICSDALYNSVIRSDVSM